MVEGETSGGNGECLSAFRLTRVSAGQRGNGKRWLVDAGETSEGNGECLLAFRTHGPALPKLN